MKNLIIAFIMLLPFFAVAQPVNPLDKRNDTESFVSLGSINGKTLFSRPVAVFVDWSKNYLLVDGSEYIFEVQKTETIDGQTYCTIETDEKKIFVLVYDADGLRGFMYPKNKIILDVEISDVYAEMKNAKK